LNIILSISNLSRL